MAKGSNFIFFVIGATVSTAVTYAYTKRKYEKILNEEIASVKDAFKKERFAETTENDIPNNDNKKAVKVAISQDLYQSLTSSPYYSHVENFGINVGREQPYVISPDDYGEMEDYLEVHMDYYIGDGVLADDNNDPMDIEDIKDSVGLDFSDHFGDYEPDCVHIRNDARKCDYEILLDERCFNEVYPYKLKGE